MAELLRNETHHEFESFHRFFESWLLEQNQYLQELVSASRTSQEEVYSKSGLQLEARLTELIRGLSTGDLGDLSPNQLHQVNELQKNTIREVREITEKHAKLQETVADTSMVELSHVVTELLRGERASAVEDGQAEATLTSKEDRLVEVMQAADDLRLKTLKQVVEVLTPSQSVHFFIAAAELHLRIHESGIRLDARNHTTNSPDMANGNGHSQ